MTADRKLYVVATVHLDTQWRWTIQDTIRDFLPATLERNFEIFEKHPFFVVSFEGAFRYQLIREYYPERFEELRRWIAKGRWRVAGSMLDSPDVNIVAPESLIRHILYGNGFFERHFGVRSRDIFLPDCFGFGFALPSLAAHCGLKGFSGQKFGRWMAPAEIPFDVGVWQGPDGAEIVAAIRPEGYGEGLDEDLSRAPRFIERLDATGRQSGAFVGIKYVGIGDRGGGLDEASVDWLARSIEGDGPVEVILSGSDQIFIDLEPDEVAALPRHRGELLLPTHGTGSLSSQAILKRWNRRNELLADAAERAAVMAECLTGLAYPAERLQQAWTRFLWHQMHDDLTGTSIPEAYRFTDNDELLSLNQFSGVLTQSVGALCSQMDTRCLGQAIAVFNPLSCPRQDLVTVELRREDEPTREVRVIGPDGAEVPAQLIDGGGGRRSVIFLAGVAPMTVQIYDLQLGCASAAGDSDLEITQGSLANHRYRIEVGADGDIHQIIDELVGGPLLSSPVRLQLLRDRSSRWPAWEIRYQDLLEENPDRVSGPTRIRILEEGPVRVALEIVRNHRRSRFRQILRLATGEAGERIEVFNQISWRTRGHLLKASFPLAVDNSTALYDLGLGVIERGNRRREKYEVPAQQWAAIRSTDGEAGVSILNDCKYGWDKPDDRTLRLTLLRSPGVVRRFRHQGRQDHGQHTFTYGIYGHRRDWQISDSCWQAARLNQPLMSFRTPNHPGRLGREIKFLGLSAAQVSLQTLKRAENGDGWVARLREMAGKPATGVSIELPTAVSAAYSVDGMEDRKGPVTIEENRIVTDLAPFGLASVAFDLSPSKPPAERFRQRSVDLPFDRVATCPQAKPDREGFDGKGHSIPAELWPAALELGGIGFALGSGSEGVANALRCRGQTLELGSHGFDRFHMLAASTRDSPTVTWRLGENEHPIVIGYFSGFLGGRPVQKGLLGASARQQTFPLGDRLPVAWVGTHRHDSDGLDEPYVFCYLFRYSLPMPPGCPTVELPDAPAVHVFAITLADDRIADTVPAQPLYD